MNSEYSTSIIDNDARWDAIVNRNGSVRAQFVYAVNTTGIFCRTGCASRLPLRENVIFFDTADDAKKSGFRACKRCQPSLVDLALPHEAVIKEVCMILDASDTPVSLVDLGKCVNMSPFHLQRIFKSALGVSPKRYAQSRGNMQPRIYKDGGRGQTVAFTTIDTDLGRLLIAATGKGICAIRFGQDDALETELRAEFHHAEVVRNNALLDTEAQAILSLIAGSQAELKLATDVKATVFQARVWAELRAIPCGETRSYSQIAESIGLPRSARAVANACARNPTALIVPCHRVIHSDGSISGYFWGVDRKRELLSREKMGRSNR